jgi:polar amino acid transport system substrate-binding protein
MFSITRVPTRRALAALSLLVSFFAGGAQSATLAQIKERGVLSVCANPDAMPYASQKAEPPGFQLEIAAAIAKGLGVSLEKRWILPRYRANLVDCDMLLDSLADRKLHECRLMLSRPYHRTGVSLGMLAEKAEGVTSFYDLKKGSKIGVMIGSLAQVVLGKRGYDTTASYAFEADIVEDLLNGHLAGAAVSPATMSWRILQDPEKRMKLVLAYEKEPELRWEVSAGFRKADKALIEAVDKVLDGYIADGTLKNIYAKYGVEHRVPEGKAVDNDVKCDDD